MKRIYKDMRIDIVLRWLLLILAMVVVSCYRGDDEFDLSTGVIISFDTNITQPEETKATIINNSNKNEAISSFGVFGYSMNDVTGELIDESSEYYEYFSNIEVSRDSENITWTYSPTKEWPIGVSNILFYGYTPYISDSTSDKYITDFTHSTTELSYKYEVPTTVEDQYDLLISGRSYADIGGTVMLIFEHQLSAIQFNVANNPNWKITKLALKGVKGRGELTHTVELGTTLWDTSEYSADVDFTIDNISYDKSDVGNDELISILGSDQTLMMIPQDIPDNAELVVTIDLVDADEDSLGEDIAISFSNTDTDEWINNYIYTYTLYIDNGNISFDGVSIKEWEDEINIGFEDSGSPIRIGYIDLDEYNTPEALQEKLEFFDETLVRKVIVSGTYWEGCFGTDITVDTETPTNPFMLYSPDIQILDLEVVEGCTELAEYAFYPGKSVATSNLTEVILPDGMETISEGLFYNCTLLNTLYLSDATQIYEGALTNCYNLTKIRFSNKADDIMLIDSETDSELGVLGDSGAELTKVITSTDSDTTINISDISLELYVSRASYDMYQASEIADGDKNPDDARPSVPADDDYSWANETWNTISYFGDAGVLYDNNINLDFYNTPELLEKGLIARVKLGYVKPVFSGAYYEGAFGETTFTPKSIDIPLLDMDYDYDWNNISSNHAFCQPNTTSPLFSVFNQLLTIDLSNVTGLEPLFTDEGTVNSLFSMDENSRLNKITLPKLSKEYYKITAEDDYDAERKNFTFSSFMFAFNQNLSNISIDLAPSTTSENEITPWLLSSLDIADGTFMGYKSFAPSPAIWSEKLEDSDKFNLSYTSDDYIYYQTISKIGNYAFFDNDNIVHVMAADQVPKDPEATTSSMYIRRTIESIGKGAFAGCSNLEMLGEYAKYENSNPYYGFEGPLTINSIGENAFAYTANLHEIHIDGEDESGNLGTISDGAFAYVKNIGELLITGYESIPSYCFQGGSTYWGFDSYYSYLTFVAPTIETHAFDSFTAYSYMSYYTPSETENLNEEDTYISYYPYYFEFYTREIADEAFVDMKGSFYMTISPYPGETSFKLGANIFKGITETDNMPAVGNNYDYSYLTASGDTRTEEEMLNDAGGSSSNITLLVLKGTDELDVDADTFNDFDTESCLLYLDENGYEYLNNVEVGEGKSNNYGRQYEWRGILWRQVVGRSY